MAAATEGSPAGLNMKAAFLFRRERCQVAAVVAFFWGYFLNIGAPGD